MATVLYRKNGGEVLKYSPRNQSFAEVDSDFFGVLVDPDAPDGTDIRERRPNKKFGPDRQFGFAKKALPGQNRIRNATQAEIDAFDDQEGIDEQKQDVKQAKIQIDEHPYLGRLLRAVIRQIMAHVQSNNRRTNQLANQWRGFKASIATANNLQDIKDAVSGAPDIPSDLTGNIDLPDLFRAVRDDLRDDDVPRRRLRVPARVQSANPLRGRFGR